MADKELEHKDNEFSEQNEGIINEDVASRSLAEALRISFGILKVIILVLVVLFIASGVFRVQYDEQALVLHFGEIRGDEHESKVLKSGLHWAWPSPIDEIVTIPVTQKQVLEIDSFWYFVSEKEKQSGKENPVSPTTPLDPLRDGYCLTRNDTTPGQGTDYSIVHSKWKLTYTIANVEKFFTNIYYNAPKPGEDFMDVMAETVEPMLDAMAGDAIVTSMVEYTIDDAIGSAERISAGVARKLQAKLDLIKSGIVVDSIQPQRITWPRQVNQAFDASNKASQDKAKLVAEAKSEADRKLNEAGGVNAEKILNEVKNPSLSEAEKEELLLMLAGTLQEKISKAKAYKTEVVESAKANAEYLQMLLDEYRKSPEFILQNIYQLMIEEVMKNAEEKIFVQPGDELRLMINRDPNIQKKRNDDQQKNDSR